MNDQPEAGELSNTMNRITESCLELSNAIYTGDSIVVTRDGEWYQRDWWVALFRRAMGWEQSDTMAAISELTKYVQKLPIASQGDARDPSETGLRSPAAREGLMNTLLAASDALQSMKRSDLSDLQQAKEEKKLLPQEQRVESQRKIERLQKSLLPVHQLLSEVTKASLSVQYLGVSQKDIGEHIALERDKNWLQKKASKFIGAHDMRLLRPEPQELLNIKIERASKYPEFIKALRANPVLQHDFLKALCRGSPQGSPDFVDMYIQAPYIQELIKKSFLDKRIQKVANKGLRFVERDDGAKEVQLLIHGTYQVISLLDGTIRTSDTTTRTVKSLFKEFKRLNDRLLDVEYLQSGVEELDLSLTAFDFERDRWWEFLPDVDVQTAEQVRERFSLNSVDQSQPLVALHTTQIESNLSLNETHGMIDVYLPKGDGTFNVISPGKFGKKFIPSMREKGFSFWTVFEWIKAKIAVFDVVFGTDRGAYVFVDQNNFMTHRHHHQFLLPPLSEGQFATTMDHIKELFINAREGRLIFQPQADNCTTPLQQLIHKLYPGVPDPFRIKFSEVTPPSIFLWLTEARRFFPSDESWNMFRKLITLFLGSSKGLIYQNTDGTLARASVINSLSWQEGYIEHPGALGTEERQQRFREHLRLHENIA